MNDAVRKPGEANSKGSKGSVKKSSRRDLPSKTVSDVLRDTFKVQVDKNKNIKPAKLTKADLKHLSTNNEIEKIDEGSFDSFCADAIVTDPGLDCAVEIALAVMHREEAKAMDDLFSLVVRLASSVWINKHRGSLDLYRDIFQDQDKTRDPVSHLESALNSAYEKRTAALKRAETNSLDNDGGSDTEKTNNQNTLTKATLDKQKRNLMLIGCMWLMRNRLVSLDRLTEYFLSLLLTHTNQKATLKDVVFLLAEQSYSPEGKFVKLVSLLQSETTGLKEEGKRLQSQLFHKEQKLENLEATLVSRDETIALLEKQLADSNDKIAGLESQIEDQALDERATRTHLRDSEGKVRAKAFNLLSEDVLEPLRLSLAALQRDNPKTEVAAHQIELVVECIERDLPWFNE